MIMSSVILTTTGLTAVILSSLQQSRAIDNAIVAYYAAESGVEESVFRLRRNGVLPPTLTTPQPLGNSSSWTVTVTPSEPVVYAGNLAQDSFAEIALYDPDQPTIATDIASVSVTWSDDCLGCSVLEAAMVSWMAGGPIAWDPNAATYRFTGGSATLSAAAGKLYRLRLLARGGNFQNVQVRAHDAIGAAVAVPGRVRVEAVGSFGSVRQRLVAVMPRELPLSGLYDFVIFTECSLVKGGPVSCP